MTVSPAEARGVILAIPGPGQEAVMTASSERRVTGGILFLLAGLAALGALATNIVLPAFPRIGAELEISSPELGLLLSSFFVAFALGQLAVGPLSDRFGRKPLVLGGLAVFAAGSVVCALAGTLPLLVLGRVIQALGLALLLSCRAPSRVTSLTARRSAGLWR
jgi:MFS transporter, DHA1 family, multidrug resistance protein